MSKRIVEINGVKVEVDLREATTIEAFRVGDHVKVLIPGYSNDFKSHAGAIIGFDNFKTRPTIVVAYLDAEYGKAEVKITYICEGSKVEMTHASEGDVPFSKQQVLDLLDRDIADKQKALEGAQWHKERFEQWFGKHFVAAQAASQVTQ
ncbi:MAG: hypothetical protein IMZ50_10410 [Candidatus Atribacteria bacterium]|nr:hypothetical protein [Candidatus Atribacteria bacterium]